MATLRSSRRLIQSPGAGFWREPWGSCMHCAPHTPLLIRRRLRRCCFCCSMNAFLTLNALQKIRTWFYNHYDRPHRQLIRFTWRWSAQNAFYHENKKEVMDLAEQMSGGAPGSQAFLGALQDATTQLWKRLSTEEQDDYADIAKTWSDDRPPKAIQAKCVTSHASVNCDTDQCLQNGLCSLSCSYGPGLSNTVIQNMWNTLCGISGICR